MKELVLVIALNLLFIKYRVHVLIYMYLQQTDYACIEYCHTEIDAVNTLLG